MSSATRGAAPDSGKRFSSIAWSISWSYWWRRLLGWLLLDVAIVLGAFACWHMATGLVVPDLGKGFSPGIIVEFRAFLGVARPFYPLAAVVLVWEIIDLVGIFSDVRRVRRKLQPLQDLALAAEAMGQAAASPMPFDADKMATLEQAIERASVDSPTVTTGDQDLRSIEVALNGLLRQMQEAKLQQMRFVNDASHELRTPIAVIQGYVNMLYRWG